MAQHVIPKGRPICGRPYLLSIKSEICLRIWGSFLYSSDVNLLSTKSKSPILFRRVSLAVLMRRRGKFSVPRWAMRDLRPLLPPALPCSRKRTLPKIVRYLQMYLYSYGGETAYCYIVKILYKIAYFWYFCQVFNKSASKKSD